MFRGYPQDTNIFMDNNVHNYRTWIGKLIVTKNLEKRFHSWMVAHKDKKIQSYGCDGSM